MDYAGIILERKDKKILFQLRDKNEDIPFPNMWSIFGGGLNKGEDSLDGLSRELKEELNLDVNKIRVRLLVSIRRKDGLYSIYQSEIESLKNFELREGSDMRFFSRKEIISKGNVVPSVKLFMRIYPFVLLYVSLRNWVGQNFIK